MKVKTANVKQSLTGMKIKTNLKCIKTSILIDEILIEHENHRTSYVMILESLLSNSKIQFILKIDIEIK